MQEYFGNSAKKYRQPSDKFYTLFPALERMLPIAAEGDKLIDLACGTGDMSELIINKGYEYIGIDISKDMLRIAKEKYPLASFILGDVTKPITTPDKEYDAVLSNMLLPSISNKNDFNAIFKISRSLIKQNGIIIMSSGHPCFDGYMGKKFFAREDVETKYQGYFQSGQNYKVYRKFNENDFIFSDQHWTLSDYFEAATNAGLYVSTIDECPVVSEVPKKITDKINSKGTPSYIVFKLKKLSSIH